MIQACPDILRSRLSISSGDAASPESLLNTIKQFQGWYAEYPGLAPLYPSAGWAESIVNIRTAYGTKQSAAGNLGGRLRAAELIALHAEIIVGPRWREHQWHYSELPVTPTARS